MNEPLGEMSNQKIVIEFVDSQTGCISIDLVFETNDIAALCKIIDPKLSEIHPAAVYDLDSGMVEKVATSFGLEIELSDNSARLRSWRALDGLPYKVHTERELAMMLAGLKPFAAFSEYYPSNPNYECIPERFFTPHVEAGLFVKWEHILSIGEGRKTRLVLYAQKSEEWRIKAYLLLKTTAVKAGWSEGFERMEGTLLGYEDWQNDVYIEKFCKRRS